MFERHGAMLVLDRVRFCALKYRNDRLARVDPVQS
jgi:hypothetical protein